MTTVKFHGYGCSDMHCDGGCLYDYEMTLDDVEEAFNTTSPAIRTKSPTGRQLQLPPAIQSAPAPRKFNPQPCM